MGKKSLCGGRADVTYSGSNHARGVRHIRFYADGKTVLDIEGDFEDQQFGSNFRFQNIDLYIPGEWETDFLKITDSLRQFTSKRKMAFKKARDAEQNRMRPQISCHRRVTINGLFAVRMRKPFTRKVEDKSAKLIA